MARKKKNTGGEGKRESIKMKWDVTGAEDTGTERSGIKTYEGNKLEAKGKGVSPWAMLPKHKQLSKNFIKWGKGFRRGPIFGSYVVKSGRGSRGGV